MTIRKITFVWVIIAAVLVIGSTEAPASILAFYLGQLALAVAAYIKYWKIQ